MSRDEFASRYKRIGFEHEFHRDLDALLDEERKRAAKEERRRVREILDKLFADCINGSPEIRLTKAALLESLYPPTPVVKLKWEDVTF